MILGKNPKRACIYFIYDRDGLVDNYILYQLKDLRESVDFIHCVINGALTPEGRKALSDVADEVYVRENKGNDIGAYKAAIRYIGWEKLSAFDELVVMNNTCFGPVYPFREVFDWASDRDLDFWGLTRDCKADWLGTNQYIHYNKSKWIIQSYFITLRKPLLGSELLKNFFDEIPEDSSYVMSGCYYEYAFPGYFEERGYKGGVYCDDIEDTNYPLLHNPKHLLETYRMPLIKKRSFFHHYTDTLNNTGGEATIELIRFIERHTDYDMDLIWPSVLRTNSLSDIVRCAQLNRILPSDLIVCPEQERTLRTGLVYYAHDEAMFDEDIAYMLYFPESTDLLITTDTEEKKELLTRKLALAGRQGKVSVLEGRGRDVSCLLVEAADFVFGYDLICFAHDLKNPETELYTLGRSWMYRIRENMFATKAYVSNVIHLFEQEKRLGLAFPSCPNHNGYVDSIGTGWMGNFQNTQKLLQAMDVSVKIHEHTLCVAPIGNCFWFRPAALRRLFDGYQEKGWSYADFPREPRLQEHTILQAIERSYAYFAQAAGYYPAYLYSDRFAQIEFTNLEFAKTGSMEMRIWMEALIADAIGHRPLEEALAEGTIQQMHSLNLNIRQNYTIRQSIKILCEAICCKYPGFWKLMTPIRWAGKKILGVKR